MRAHVLRLVALLSVIGTLMTLALAGGAGVSGW